MISSHQLTHEVANLSGSKGESLRILNNINLQIGLGETVAIVGASGSGKSTLLGMLAGLDLPSSGEVRIGDTNLCELNEEQRAALRADYVAFVFQNFQLLDSLTALENVSLAMELKSDPQAQQKARDTLERVGLAERMQHYPHQLSGGEQQRVALARAFACEAPIIFADEPTGNLDSATGERISDLLFKMNAEHNTTLVLVTHSNALAARCQRQLQMRAGEIYELKAESAR